MTFANIVYKDKILAINFLASVAFMFLFFAARCIPLKRYCHVKLFFLYFFKTCTTLNILHIKL